MTESKYETFKKATFELLEAQGHADTLVALKEIASAVDRVEESPKKESAEMTKEEFGKLSYPEKVQLKKDSPELYEKLVRGGK